jgi:hypothetical protein
VSFTVDSFTDQDVEAVAMLARQYFPEKGRASVETVGRILRYQYLMKECGQMPPSMVCRDREGKPVGFLGVTNIPFQYRDRVITGAYASDFLISESARNSLTALRMLKVFFSGPQDFSFTDDANLTSRQLWERLGGMTAYSQSIYYKTPVRPASFIARPIVKGRNRAFGITLCKSAFLIDFLMNRVNMPRFRPEQMNVTYQLLKPDDLINLMELHMRGYYLHPRLTKDGAQYYLGLIEMEEQYGKLFKAAVVDDRGYVDWFVYYLNSDKSCSVLYSESLKGREDLLFKSLLWHSYRQGGVELSGRLNPVQAGTWIGRNSLLLPGRFWAMVHTAQKELLADLLTDKAFLRRL